MREIVLKVENINKRFGATQALKDVSFAVEKGTIHSLLGRNGAGKSTVVNIIAGIYKQNDGTVTLEGKDVTPYSVFERQNMGIKLVPQHASIVPELTVGENIFVGIWPEKKGFVDWKTLYKMAEAELKKYGLEVDPKEKVKNLNAVDQRKVNIVRAMHGGAKVIILDEPTTALSTKERAELFVFVNELKARGTSFIFISHYLQEVVELSDDVTVIRDGCSFTAMDEDGLHEEKLANLIAGEEVELIRRQRTADDNQRNLLVEVDRISGSILKDVSVNLYKGEITGVVGFPGSGAREFLRTLFGLEKVRSGKIVVKDSNVMVAKSPWNAIKNGISYVSNDRHKEGIVDLMTIEENISLPLLYSMLKGRFGFVDKNKSKGISRDYFDLFHIKANTIYDKLSSLSGGNQQKVVVAKAVSSSPKLLMLDEPTIGIDIKSREEIIENVIKIVEEKQTSVLYLTNDFDELVRAVDRILFFNEGKLVKDVRNKDLTHDDIISIRDSLADEPAII